VVKLEGGIMNPSTQQAVDERREFLRVDYRRPVKFRFIDTEHSKLRLGTTTNVSQSGILFRSNLVPKIASLLWLNVDLKTLKICQEIESRVIVYHRGVLGRVVRVDEDEFEDFFHVAVCFVTKDDAQSQEFKF
jgi:hypothetical protein